MPIDTNAAKQAASILSTFGPLTAAIPVAGPFVALGMQAGAIIAGAFADANISAEEARAKALASLAELVDTVAALPGVVEADDQAAVKGE